MNEFLKEEAVGKDKAAMFQVTFKQVSSQSLFALHDASVALWVGAGSLSRSSASSAKCAALHPHVAAPHRMLTE